MRSLLAAAAGMLAAVAFSLPAVQAAPQLAQAEQGQQGQQAKEFKDETLDKFARAQQRINRVRQDYRGKIQNAGDADKKEELKKQATEEMRQAVKDEGLALDKYSEVAKQANQNPELQEDLKARIQAVQQERGQSGN